MNGILQPGIAILENLRFRGKFSLIGAILFTVIALLSFILIRTLLAEISSVQHERRGMAVIGKVVPVLIEIQKHRGLNAAYLGGDGAALAKLQAINSKQEGLITEADRDGGIQAFGMIQEWNDLRAAWTEVRDRSPSYTKPQSFAEHTRLVARMQAFIIRLADAGGVTLDPRLDTYYLQDTALVKLISLSESIGKLRAKGSGVLAAKTATPEERAELNLLSGSIGIYEEAVRQNLEKSTSQDAVARKLLGEASTKISERVAALQRTVSNDVLIEAPTLAASDYFSQATSTIDAVLELYGLTDKELNRLLLLRESELKRSLSFDVVLIVIGVLISIYFFMAMSASISKAVDEIDHVVDGFSQGDLTRRVNLASKDEMGNIASHFNAAGDHLRSIMLNVERSVQDVFAAAEALQVSSRQISNDSEHESEAVQSTAAAIEQITSSISMVADNSRDASSAAGESLNISETGEARVRNAAAEMNSIAASVGESASLIDGLNERARQISSIVGVIRDIADQTNLLALNAAIEAARAGEQGRGFAVVADEVRKLAERTGNATGEITAMISDIQRETANAVVSMETGSAQAKRGVQMAEEAASSLAQVHAGSQDTRVRIEEIADAMREQSAATTDIAKNLERISVMSENTNRAVQSATQSIAQLESLAEQLRQEVSTFKV